MEQTLFFRFFAGVSMDEPDALPLVPLGRWLLPVAIYLLIIALSLGAGRKNRLFAIVRYGNIQRWWKYHYFKNMLYGWLAASFLLLLPEAAELLLSQHLPNNLPQRAILLLLWTLHAMVFLSLFLFLETTPLQKAIPSLLLLLEGITFLYGYRNKAAAHFMFGTWGMYAQSRFHDQTYGFPVPYIIAIQSICIAICYLAGGSMLKRKE